MTEVEYEIHLRPPHEHQEKFQQSTTKRKVIKAGRRGGKTVGIAAYSVEQFVDGRRVLYGAPTTDQVETYWAEVVEALEEPIDAGILIKNESRHTIVLPGTTQRIRAKTAWNSDTWRGGWADVIIMDEFQLIDETAYEDVVQPMLLDTNGDLVLIYTPPSLKTLSQSKAKDPKFAAKLFKKALAEMAAAAAEGRIPDWEAFHFKSQDNPYLSKEAFKLLIKDMHSTSYKREILAEDDDDIEGALWKRVDIDKTRFTISELIKFMPTRSRIVVGVDPPGGATECGIIVAVKGSCSCKGTPEEHVAILQDASLKSSPDGWATAVNNAYKHHAADRILGEKNFGGDMVESTIRSVNPAASYKNVNASRGKAVRAEPIAAKYEQGKFHHVGTFSQLEDEMCNWISGRSNYSPNRMDALVWCGIELLPDFAWEFS